MQALLEKAKKVLLHSDRLKDIDEDTDLLGLTAFGVAHTDWEQGTRLFRKQFLLQDSDGKLVQRGTCSPPFHGFLLAGFYEVAPDEKSARSFLEEMYPKVFNFHHYLYQHRDPEEEGLISIYQSEIDLLSPTDTLLKPNSRQLKPDLVLQDPLYNALLIWSNECLSEIGTYLGKDVSQILQWNELSIFSFNDKLWDEENGIYRAFDLQSDTWILDDSIVGILPMIGEIPDQDQAELLLEALQSDRFQVESNSALNIPLYHPDNFSADKSIAEISIFINWLLYHGLWRYGMTAAANQIRQKSLALMDEFGFQAFYKQPIELNHKQHEEQAFLPAAALGLSWLTAD